MQVITKRDKILGVADEWKANYYHGHNTWSNIFNKGSAYTIYKRLLNLDLNTCTEEDVEKVIGNRTWTDLTCYECDLLTDTVVLFEHDKYNYTFICKTCIQNAMSRISELKNR